MKLKYVIITKPLYPSLPLFTFFKSPFIHLDSSSLNFKTHLSCEPYSLLSVCWHQFQSYQLQHPHGSWRWCWCPQLRNPWWYRPVLWRFDDGSHSQIRWIIHSLTFYFLLGRGWEFSQKSPLFNQNSFSHRCRGLPFGQTSSLCPNMATHDSQLYYLVW